MKTNKKGELRKMSMEKLNELKSNLIIKLMTSQHKSKKIGFNPPMGSPTGSVSNLKKQIARINTFITEKNDN